VVEFAALPEALAVWSGKRPQFIVLDDAALADDAKNLAATVNDEFFTGSLFILGCGAKDGVDVAAVETFPKPVRLGYLFARLQFFANAQTRDDGVTLGSWRFEPRERRLFLPSSEKSVQLTDKEASVLDYLYRAGGPVSRDNLLAVVWGYEEGVDTHTLETHIYRLRRKLSSSVEFLPEGDVFLVDRRGYQINPSWRRT
jgi:DNA-binding response OmpR family regulator